MTAHDPSGTVARAAALEWEERVLPALMAENARLAAHPMACACGRGPNRTIHGCEYCTVEGRLEYWSAPDLVDRGPKVN